jgi:hypothetical protein
MANKKMNRDYPLSESPDPGERKPYYTRKEFRSEMQQAKREHKIQAAREGTLADERMKRAKDIVGLATDVISTAASAKSLGSSKRKSLLD